MSLRSSGLRPYETALRIAGGVRSSAVPVTVSCIAGIASSIAVCSIAVIARCIAVISVIARSICVIAVIIRCIAVISGPVIVPRILHALAEREAVRGGGEIGRRHRRCRDGHDAAQRSAGDQTDCESFHGRPRCYYPLHWSWIDD